MPQHCTRRLIPDLRGDFDRVQGATCTWCQCVAWHVPTWDGFGERTAAENRALREALWARGEDDGYLHYVDDQPVAWCQVGPRDRLPKLVAMYRLAPDPNAWAFTCFRVVPAFQRQGIARQLLTDALADLAARGVRRVEAFPDRSAGREPGEQWTGPEALLPRRRFHRRTR